MAEECRRIALNHVDMMFHIYCTLGYPLGLDKAAQGMATPGKPEGMNGALANEMWNNGDRLPVIQYCASDVRSTPGPGSRVRHPTPPPVDQQHRPPEVLQPYGRLA